MKGTQESIMKGKVVRNSKKFIIAIIGVLVVAIGLIMVPYPGPGWLVVFVGLAILSSEFKFAQDILDKAHYWYDKWQEWLKNQGLFVQLIVLALVGAITVITIWLLNGFGVAGNILNINIDWLVSPFFR